MGIKVNEKPIKHYIAELDLQGLSGFVSSYLFPYSDTECLLIDTGPQNSYTDLLESINRTGCIPKHAFITHIHLDHGGAAGSFIRDFPDSIVYVHPRGKKHIVNPEKLWESSLQALGEVALLYGRPYPANEKNVMVTEDNQEVKLGEIEIIVLHTPGHASHHQSFFMKNEKILFTGDSAGMYFSEYNISIPTTPRPFFYESYMDSLRKQKSMNPEYIAFPHNTIIENNEYIESHIEQIDTWIGVLERFVEKNVGDIYNEAIKKIAEVDDNVKKMRGLVKSIYGHLLIMSIDGMLDYLRRKNQ